MKTPEDEAFEEIERIQRTRTRWVPVNKPQDEIFAMAKEAGFMQHLGVICIPNVQNLEDFAKLVAAKEREIWERRVARLQSLMDLREQQPNKPCCIAEREACAKAVDAAKADEEDWDSNDWNQAVEFCASRIRARGQA